MAVPISNVVRRVVFAPSGVGPYAFTFEILANTDIEVYKGNTLLTLTTDYTVTINANGTGSVTLVVTAGADNITIVGARTIERTTDFVTGGDLFANSLNEELDSLTIFVQQNSESGDRAIKAPVTDPTTIDMTLPVKTSRAGKYLSFNTSTGDPEVVNNVVDVTAVAANAANINTVAGISGNVTTVAGVAANVTTVAGIAANVTTVAGIAANVTTVAGISANVTTVAGISADVTTVAGDSADIQLLAANIGTIASKANVGANSDITSLSGLTTPLSVVQGGTGITSFGTGVATFLGTPSSANLAAAVTNETGSGSLVFATSPSLVTPVLGTPTSGNLNNCTADGTNKVGYQNIPPVGTKTGSYTLAVGDVGEYVQVGSGGSITIPNATFAEGDAVSIFNNTSAGITITCTITTAYIAGTDTDKATVTLATRGVATILFISGTVCVITGNVS